MRQRYLDAKAKNSFWYKLAEDVMDISIKNRARYEAVAKETGFHWCVVAVIHSLESNQNFTTHLHNGDPLTARTVQVPAGRPIKGEPPFTWQESAIDALKGYSAPEGLEDTLEFLERYNGLGYRYGAGMNTTPPKTSPYLWSGTDQYIKGKYVADGAFDGNAVSQQIGAVLLLKTFERAGLINLERKQMPEVTWWGFHRNTNGKPSLVGYAGPLALERIDTNSVDEIVKALQFSKAKTFVVSDKSAPSIDEPEAIVPDYATLTRYNDAVKMPSVWRNAGLKPLCLKIGDEEFLCVSGQGYAQNFRKPEDSKSYPGNMEPIPQGNYSIANIDWKNGKDNYSGSWGPGLGPVWVGLTAQHTDDRGAFGFHIDENISNSPGSAGCVVFSSMDELKRFVGALRKHDPKTLKVDWKLS